MSRFKKEFMEWISVKDRLPECDLGIFLVYCPKQAFAYDGIFTAYWEKGNFIDNPPNCGCTGFGEVTHWMPLPLHPIQDIKIDKSFDPFTHNPGSSQNLKPLLLNEESIQDVLKDRYNKEIVDIT